MAGGARGVARLENVAGVGFHHIAAARRRTERGLEDRRALLASLDADDGATVVLMGSWGRHEVTSESDDDAMILFEGSPREDAKPTVEDVAARLGGPPPGPGETFAAQVWLDDLRAIGLEDGTNKNLTRRMLFVLESVPACGGDTHTRARRSLLASYLDANVKHHRPPRFLLNDVIRYWRTIAVDFESKMRDRKGDGWGLRNAKLRLSRKTLFAGGLLPILECHAHATEGMLDHLAERMSVPPLDRIADAFVDHDAIDPGVRALVAYDEFLPARTNLADLGRGDGGRGVLLPSLGALAGPTLVFQARTPRLRSTPWRGARRPTRPVKLRAASARGSTLGSVRSGVGNWHREQRKPPGERGLSATSLLVLGILGHRHQASRHLGELAIKRHQYGQTAVAAPATTRPRRSGDVASRSEIGGRLVDASAATPGPSTTKPLGFRGLRE